MTFSTRNIFAKSLLANGDGMRLVQPSEQYNQGRDC
jgi:hypothetical protein